MGLFDRLQAVDRRLLYPRRKRPPSRSGRWIARHPWATVLLWMLLMTIQEVAWDRSDLSIIDVLVFLLFGCLLSWVVRRDVTRWDRGDSGSEP